MKVEQKVCEKSKGWKGVSKRSNINDKVQLVFLFGDRMMLCDKRYLKEIKEFYPNARMVGCSTSGEIVGTEVLENSIVATAVFFENGKLDFAEAKVDSMDKNFEVGQKLVNSIKKDGLIHAFVLSEGLNINGSLLAKGLVSILPPNVAVTGGLAGDSARFKETVVFLDDNPEPNKVVLIGFYGKRLRVGYGSMGGWDSFGQDRLVTRSKGNILYELDGKPALDLYKKYLGDQAEGLPATGLLFPLSLRLEDSEAGLVRTILSVDEKEGSMTFAGEIPEGIYVRLMKASMEHLIDGALGAAKETSKRAKGTPGLAILISCIGRKLVLKQRVEEEIEVVKEVLGKTVSLAGFYSYGELCPLSSDDKKCELHNQTMTITAFYES